MKNIKHNLTLPTESNGVIVTGKLTPLTNELFINEIGELFSIENHYLLGRKVIRLSKAYGSTP